ncbi:SDR family oxidoreductase [Synechococcus sp. A10-1-5-1]|uniref:SDR family NAD(P)-dependent oxidoreductase n=1 Tax=Synechococcus sp. A10-1-5-1 TaxID=2936507 RepID=UPI0020009B01|nr:SDR family oxidoreductase [Synechococcus sp. A10-1-5-1]UPM49184.1 SDR family oxidoreductase [Synechococcus sp. A10-1-5-1]
MSSITPAKTVLVTGAAGGIGAGLVEALAEAGWMVLGSDHPSTPPSNHVRQRCQAWISADLAALSRHPHQLETFQVAVLSAVENGKLMAVVHNAAVQYLGSFEQLGSVEWHETLEVNLMAPVTISRALLPQLKRHRGSIVHIGSIHSQLTKPGFTAYATSKAALAGLTRAMAVELGDSVRVNAIEPAAIATPMLEAGFADTPVLKAQLEAFHPTGAIGSPEDVARAVLFLLDPANTFLNGCVLPLGGGIHSRLYDPA